MSGLNRFTGRRLDPNSDEHLVQSIGDILSTPLNLRIGRRAYGSEIPDLIDQPLNARTRIRIFAATAMALQNFEPRVRLKRVQLLVSALGRASLQLDVIRTDRPRRTSATLSVSLRTA
ncbi:hypothetical protein GCM10017620_25810 [Brevundimonas intermedia]|uniref:IraD/Gp25-like domain-containing protein n=1 Tax=Brevundimonas intermedia TaxID=74315 RepID=A0ABQ5TB51_9CAUL|nr:GPW/gp25 family protein [Brevundimonas intermedia]GLK49608.1 hypothetical protein GCM10017620_25810 [Brevundimonas intermedia]